MKIENFFTFLTIINAGIAAISAGFVAFAATRQYKLAKDKFKFDLFEKRLTIYNYVESFLAGILREANVTMEMKNKLYTNTRDAVFLFGDDIVKYLEQIQNKASELYVLQKEPLTERNIDKETELLQWFDQITGENPKIIEKFSPYLKFKTWK